MDIKDLKAEASELGLTYSPNVGYETLRKKIQDFKLLQEAQEEFSGETTKEQEERIRKDSNQLVRAQINCLNSSKSELTGEFFMASNRLGTVRKYVAYNTPWHIPQILLNVIEEKRYTMYDARNQQRKELREYQIDILPPLTYEELEDLRHQEALLAKSQGE